MANHTARGTKPPEPETPPPPRIEWGQIQKVGEKYHFVRIVTQGDRILEQHIDKGETWRPIAEAVFQRWAVEKVLDRNEDA